MEWDHLVAEFTHIRQLEGGQYGGLNAEVRWSTTLPGVAPHLHEARMNLSSSSARESLARMLTRRVESETIADFVEYACVLVIRRHREGRPLVNLADITPVEPRYAIGQLFPLGKRCQIYAPAENLKTTLVLAFLMDVALAVPSLGFDVEPGVAGLLDWETDEDDATSIWHRLALGRDLDTVPDLFYQRCHRPIWEEAEALAPQLKAANVNIVALDSVFWISGGNPNDQEKVGLAFQGIDALGPLTSILINHTGADQADKTRRRHYGLEHWRNACRASWEVRKADVPGSDWTGLGLYRDKLNMRRAEGPFGFRIRFEGDAGPIYVERSDSAIDETPELEESRPATQRVRTYLIHHAWTRPKELAEALALDTGAVHLAIHRLGSQVIKQGIGKDVAYAIATKQEEA